MNNKEEIDRFAELERQAGTYLDEDRFNTLIARGYFPGEIYVDDIMTKQAPPRPPIFIPGELKEFRENVRKVEENEE